MHSRAALRLGLLPDLAQPGADESGLRRVSLWVLQELQVDANVAFAIWTARLPTLLASPQDAPPLPLQQAKSVFRL